VRRVRAATTLPGGGGLSVINEAYEREPSKSMVFSRGTKYGALRQSD
jgi:hypothetical protein